MQPVLHLIRGIPGSGKSTFAKILSQELNISHFEADMWFELNNITWHNDHLSAAHSWCLESTENELRNNKSVVVSNTFTRKIEMLPYYEIAEYYGARVVEKIMTGRYQNVHGCPPHIVLKMIERFEH